MSKAIVNMMGGVYGKAEREATRFALPDSWRVERAAVEGVAIDPPGTIERDDAIAVYGGHLVVSIVDVSVLDPLRQQSILKRAAGLSHSLYGVTERKASIYMMPQSLIKKIGINAKKETPTITCRIPLDGISNGIENVMPEVFYSILHAETTSYGAAQRHFESQRVRPSMRNSELIEGVLALKEVMDIDGLAKNRKYRKTFSQKLVGAAMVAANVAMANYFEENNIIGVYRSHESGDLAFYCMERGPHAGVGVSRYMHFTSPLRRYTDLLNHLALAGHMSAVGDTMFRGLDEQSMLRACTEHASIRA
jgi:exoribonuclease R